MLDGTPLLDIKPYMPAFDDRAGAGSAGSPGGWIVSPTLGRTAGSDP